MVGGQTSLEVGFAAAIVAVLIGTLYGAFPVSSAARSTRS